MKYANWFVRLVFVAWMLPAGLNHFVPLFPQPLGNQPLSRELFAALADSHLFDLVKAVELIAGLSVLTGLYVPLALLLCMPVSFCVCYWDAPLQGWFSVSAIYGWAVLLCNALLCLGYVDSYRAMLAPRAPPAAAGPDRARLVRIGRLILGAGLLVNGANFFMHLYPLPAGHHPLAVQLMAGLEHSQLLDVAMAIQAVAGALILADLFVPLALSLAMPIAVCAAFWAVILEHEPIGAALALATVALNGLLMLAWLGSYRGVLQRSALAAGETTQANYDALYADPRGRTARGPFIGALIPLAAAALFYHLLVYGAAGHWAMLVLLFPAVMLHARRLHDMGWPALLLILPGVPVAAAIWFGMFHPGAGFASMMILIGLSVGAAVTLWCLIAKSRAGANRYGRATPARA